MRFSIVVAAAVSASRVAALAGGYNIPNLLVETTSGIVKGVVSEETGSVRIFCDVPYAEYPINELRFRPPLKKARATRTIDASEWGPACSQITNAVENIYSLYFKGFGKPEDVPTVEDCLHVKIWVPRGKNSKELKPVLIFVHGGSHNASGNSFPYYDGGRLVQDNQDVISVSLNYRLNVFGFPSAAGLNGQLLNPGYMDQRLAIEWTR
ncbi:Alpha/Beta hydrolase protein [Aspergillus undulatus]|uniref:Alpha/Beta hydrolase protein n=1 Tax=Aspergillus undulatus TaxID=1810928 RepID=UPI003CCE3E9A